MLNAAETQLQFSTYYDSNIQESPTSPDTTFGFIARGRLTDELRRSRILLQGEILAHTYFDGHDPYENKVIFNGDAEVQYSLSTHLRLQGRFQHFLKSFVLATGSYNWSSFSPALQYVHHSGYAVRLGYSHRYKVLEGSAQYRFVEECVDLNHQYHFNTRWFLEGSLLLTDLVHKDIEAVEVFEDTSLTSLGIPQKDRGLGGVIHCRYRGKIIIGSRIGARTVRSNSVIGDYRLWLYQIYLSGNFSPSLYFHLVFRWVDKDYRYPELEGVSWYRDPEEHDQNLTHLRIERVVNGTGILYFQASALRNESLLNHQYYRKILVEVGLKYTL